VSSSRPDFLRKLDAPRDRSVGWLNPCPWHAGSGFAVLIRPDDRLGRYTVECLEANDGDPCASEDELLKLLGLTKAELGFDRARWRLLALSQATPRQTRWLLPGLIPLRFLTLVAGIGGLGKSTYLVAIAAAGSVAETPWETIYVSFEDTADEVLRPRLEAAGGDPGRVHELVLADADSLESFSLPRDVDELHARVRECSARLVVIDPIVAAVETKLDAYKDQHVRQVLAQLWRIAREEDCAVVMVGHLNRVPSTDAYLRIANSTAFWNAARSVVLVTEDGDDANGRRLIAQRKANLTRLAPVERHELEEIVLPGTVDPETGSPIVTSRMRFLEIADDVDPAAILGPQKVTKTETAETLLAQMLADGDWHESDGLKKLLKGAGYPERTVQRAANDLGVEHDRRRFPSSTWWRLPVAPPTVAPPLLSTSGATGDSAQPCGSDAPAVPVAPTRVEQDANGARPLLGDPMYPVLLAEAFRDGHLTMAEANQQLALHKLVERAVADSTPAELDPKENQ
jgi:putative DNA primase/helicase